MHSTHRFDQYRVIVLQQRLKFITLLRINGAEVASKLESEGGRTNVQLMLPDGKATIELAKNNFTVHAGEYDKAF